MSLIYALINILKINFSVNSVKYLHRYIIPGFILNDFYDLDRINICFLKLLSIPLRRLRNLMVLNLPDHSVALICFILIFGIDLL